MHLVRILGHRTNSYLTRYRRQARSAFRFFVRTSLSRIPQKSNRRIAALLKLFARKTRKETNGGGDHC